MALPSKKVLSLLVLTGAVVASVMLAFGKDKSATAINFASNLVAGEKVSIPENPNWQSEVSKIVSSADPSSTTEPGEAGSVTDTVSTTLISNYLSLKQSGTLDQTSAQKLIDSSINFISQNSELNGGELKFATIPDFGRQTIAEYGESIGLILKTTRPEEVKNEIAIIEDLIEKKDSGKITELQSIIDIYKEVNRQMKQVSVPQSFFKAHIDTLVGIANIIIGLEEVKKVFDDPLIGLQGMERYRAGGVLFAQAVQASSEFIRRNNIAYKQGSGGYYLLYGL